MQSYLLNDGSCVSRQLCACVSFSSPAHWLEFLDVQQTGASSGHPVTVKALKCFLVILGQSFFSWPLPKLSSPFALKPSKSSSELIMKLQAVAWMGEVGGICGVWLGCRDTLPISPHCIKCFYCLLHKCSEHILLNFPQELLCIHVYVYVYDAYVCIYVYIYIYIFYLKLYP